MTHAHDAQFMRLAYREALRAVGHSDPNPAVGAIIVSGTGEILSRGFTHRAGFTHAERHALSAVPTADLSQATLYVTLEPCCHHGRTPPCVDAILDRRLKRVVIAERDFAAEVMGRSVKLLQDQGVDVTLMDAAAFEREAWYTTGSFFFARKHGRPRLTLKWAQTSDGALAPQSGPSGAISGKSAAFMTAALRSFHKFTLATPGAVVADKPRLNVRFDGQSTDLSATGLTAVFRDLILDQPDLTVKNRDAETQLKPAFRGFLASPMNPVERSEFYSRQSSIGPDFKVFAFSHAVWRTDFKGAMHSLLGEIQQLGFNSILIEAGPGFSRALLEHDLVDALVVYRARGKTSHSLWGDTGRGNPVSQALASAENPPALSGFDLWENAVFPEDDFFFFRRQGR